MWGLPEPGIQPTSPAWTGRILTSRPSGKPSCSASFFLTVFFSVVSVWVQPVQIWVMALVWTKILLLTKHDPKKKKISMCVWLSFLICKVRIIIVISYDFCEKPWCRIEYSTDDGYYYYFIFRSMHNKLVTMVVSRKKWVSGEGSGRETYILVYFSFYTFQTLYPLYTLLIQNKDWF